MPFVIEQDSLPTLVNNNEAFLDCLLSIYPDPAHNPRRRAKLYVDDVDIPIKSATWSNSTGGTGTLQIELARLSDRTAFTRTASIKLDSEAYISSAWTVVKTYCDGAILATSEHTIEGSTPNDSFSVTVKSVLQQKLDLTPDQIVVLYDPDKITVNEDELETIPNIDGTEGTPTVTPYASMNLGDVFDYLADLYGCVGHKTNINVEQWPQTRVDFPPAQPYWNTVAGILGNHKVGFPTIDSANYLVFRDGTVTDYLSARAMTVSNIQRLTLTNTIERFKGCFLNRQMQADNWDYWELRVERKNNWNGGVSGTYPMTEVVTWYQDFYKIGVSIPVNSQEFSVRQLEYSSASQLISATAERFSYQFGQGGIRMTRREMKEWGYGNVPSTWVTFNATIPGPNTEFAGAFSGPEEAFTASNVTSHSEAFVLQRAERTIFSYSPLTGQSDVSFAGQTDTEIRGLIVTDTENQQLGSDFEQPWLKAQESGNLAEGQNARWGTTDHRKENQRAQRRKRQVQLRTRRHSALNSTNGLIAENYHDRRIGDIGESDIQTEAKPVYITENGDATASLWRNVNGGDAPIEILQPLCNRLNKSQDYPGGIAADLPYYDETMEIGVVLSLSDRAGTSLGIYEVIGYTDQMRSLEEGGFQTSVQTRQIG